MRADNACRGPRPSSDCRRLRRCVVCVQTMVQQGAVRACLRLLHSQPDLPPEIALIVRQTLSRLLMITNPSKVVQGVCLCKLFARHFCTS